MSINVLINALYFMFMLMCGLCLQAEAKICYVCKDYVNLVGGAVEADSLLSASSNLSVLQVVGTLFHLH